MDSVTTGTREHFPIASDASPSGDSFLKHALVIVGLAAGTLAVGAMMYALTTREEDSPERTLKIVGAALLGISVLPTGILLYRDRLAVRLSELGLVVSATLLAMLMVSYFVWAGHQIALPADILIWSESDFVNDILKFRNGYPIFTADVNNESFTYVPGTQLVTYAVASLAGFPTSVTAYRAVQVFFTLLAAFFAFLCCRRLVSLAAPKNDAPLRSSGWSAVWFSALFLIACNTITNPFTFLLHNDALAQLVIVFAYWLLLEYEHTRDRRLLWAMMLVPAVGFWVKQSIIIWALIYCAYVAYRGRSESLRTSVVFAVSSAAAVAISIGVGWMLWGEYFRYWVFDVLGAHGVSPLRSFKHLLDVWIYFAAGIAAGYVILARSPRLGALWLTWLFIIATETYTSGIAWMLNHIGPGSLLAGVWMFAALALVWNSLFSGTLRGTGLVERSRAIASLAVLGLIFSGLGLIHVPQKTFGQDAYRYVAEIESEFSGLPADRVLLDVGSWTYIRTGTVMKDRAPSIGERGYSETGDFSGILSRLNEKHYDKILVRNLHKDDFWYDHSLWNRSSGIREALLKNYVEIKTIKEVSGVDPLRQPYGFQPVSVLVPRTD